MRKALGILAALAAAGLLVSVVGGRWYQVPWEYPEMAQDGEVRWIGITGPAVGDHSAVGRIAGAVSALSPVAVAVCGLLLALAASIGARPRWPALVTWALALCMMTAQLISMSKWRLREPGSYGWGRWLYFVAGLILTSTAFILWLDAHQDAKQGRKQLAQIEAEQRAAALADLPGTTTDIDR